MLPFFWYMLKVIICSGILFGYYWFFLRNKIFHRYNRFYLLAAMSLSLLLPLLKINFWQPAADTNQAIRVLQAVSAGDEYMENIVLTAKRSNWSLEQLYPIIYVLVSFIFFFVMLRTLYLIRTLLKKYPVQRVEDVAFVNTEDDSTPFSFLKYIFWNSSIDIDTTTGRQIFKHEVAHIQEKHTHDKLFVNIILIFCWCNPFFWLYRKELNMIHEFIADKKAVEDSDTSAFAAMILQAAYPKHRFELANNFFYSPIKRRLMMLTKNKNPRVNYFGRIMVLPLAVLIFAAFTLKTKSNSSIYNGKKITVIIDAGHGGQDAGATSADGIFEKDLTLAIAKKIKELNGNNAIEIVLVRDGDVFMNPKQKVEFAKSKNADLVISFHIDNGPKKSANTKTGMSVFVAKDEFANAGNSKILASAIINEFSNNYGLAVMQQPNQSQGSIWILQANTCPAVLIEAGFINNDKDLAYLQTTAAKETIAKNVLEAIEKYFTGKPVNKNSTDTLPTLAPSDLAALNSTGNYANTLDYYKMYGKAATYKGQKIKSVFIRNTDNKAIVELANGTKVIMTQAEAFKANIIAPPPPPPPPPQFDPAVQTKDSQKESTVITSAKGILYIGINNPIMAYATGIKEKDLVLEISNGSLTGSNGNNYIARVSKPGKTIITLRKLGESKIINSFEFTAKRLPDITDPAFPEELKRKTEQQKNYGNDADIENSLYVINGRIIGKGKTANADIDKIIAEKVYVKWLKKSEAIAKYGKDGTDGACEVTYTNGDVIRFSENVNSNRADEMNPNGEPILKIGATSGGRIQSDYLKSVKEISLSTGFKLVSGTLYLQGPGFDKNVVMITLNSNSLLPASKYINQCEDDAKLVFDDVRYTDQNGVIKKMTNPPVFIVGFNNTSTSSMAGKKLEALDLHKEIEKQKFILGQQVQRDNKIFTEVEQNPEFTGGQDEWRKYLRENLKAITPVDEGWKAGVYKVVVKFIVHTDGSVSDVTTEDYTGTKTALHCIDVIKNAPKWQPAMQNGRKVNAYKKQPITFVIEE